MKLLKYLFGKKEPELERKTHDYTKRCCGHDYTFEPVNGGMQGIMCGWGIGIAEGDYLILDNKNGRNGSSRYVVNQITYFSDPSDMWRADVSFAARRMP